ncbi:uncharacterized protein CANTADRAFT_22310 [Suhomyces tanzawaensis NRRL Y-17324]|uniref:Uncharacterized protein n=1 Tax=Suhomyces tanzawaensis NRRL Y-17324 TaxID=984487 RepID=A0A1E4SFK5_9ASCO|nr:uncharacterized protein CANTADRAFT_22310 [Suhomyces tanzawaensis NRRL Y-17324]ODV78294.1 hypothetical protein CANTADRAFT_22310 [Suhomyces tanzawaensis NRRL Y-17324]
MGANEEDWSIISSSSDFDDESTTSSRDAEHDAVPEVGDYSIPSKDKNLDDTVSLTPHRRDSDRTQTGLSDTERSVSESWIKGLEPFDGDIDEIDSALESGHQDVPPTPESDIKSKGGDLALEPQPPKSAVSFKINFYENLSGINESVKLLSSDLYSFYGKRPLEMLTEYVSPETETGKGIPEEDLGDSNATINTTKSETPATDHFKSGAIDPPLTETDTPYLIQIRKQLGEYLQSLQTILDSNSAYLMYYISIAYLVYSLSIYLFDTATLIRIKQAPTLTESFYERLRSLVYEEEKQGYFFYTTTKRTNRILRGYSKVSANIFLGTQHVLGRVENISSLLKLKLDEYVPRVVDFTQTYGFLARNSAREYSKQILNTVQKYSIIGLGKGETYFKKTWEFVSNQTQKYSVIGMARAGTYSTKSWKYMSNQAGRGWSWVLNTHQNWGPAQKEFQRLWNITTTEAFHGFNRAKVFTSSVWGQTNKTRVLQSEVVNTCIENIQTCSKYLNSLYRQTYRSFWETPNLPAIAQRKELTLSVCT